MAERDLQRACLQAIKGRKDVWVLNVPGSVSLKTGTPDLLLCVRGRFVAAELKLSDGSYGLTGAQRVNLRLIRQAGGSADVVRSVDEFLALIDSV